MSNQHSHTHGATETRARRAPRVGRSLALAATIAGVAAAGAAAPAGAADFGVTQFEADAANTQAGAHSDVTTTIAFRSERFYELFPGTGFGDFVPNEDVRSIALEIPPGLIANAAKAPACSRVDFANNGRCAPETQVGNAVVTTTTFLAPPLGMLPTNSIFNLEPAPGEPAAIGLRVGGSRLPAVISLGVRNSGRYPVTALSTNIETQVPIKKLELTLWGVPADSSHDLLRAVPNGQSGSNPNDSAYGIPSSAPRTPFMVNPTDCDMTPVTTLRTRSYDHPDDWVTLQAESSKATGCDQLRFAPTITVTPDTTQPDSPTGMGVRVGFPQNDDPDGIATPALRDAVVEMPPGVTISPSAATGLGACSDAQSAIGTEDAAACPDNAKIGTVSVDVPALRTPLEGALYVGTQESNDPTSGKMFRFFLVANGHGIRLKLEGAVRADPLTGQLRATFADNPPVPVKSIDLHFKGGPRAVLATPPTCGASTTTSRMTSWGGPAADATSVFNVDCVPDLGTFRPGFRAGTRDGVAGTSSPFNLLMSRADGQDVISGLRLAMPEGLLANLKGNVGTQVGTVTADAGPGSNPYRFPGKVFLEGPYDDAPFSLRVVLPAKAGPFDLGEVVVRQKIYVDPTTAQVTVVSDPIPTIVEGVPVRLRNMSVDIDKPGFMINPTSCAEKEIGAVATSLAGQSAQLKTRFQVGGCDRLAVKPQLKIDVLGKKQLGYHKHPGIKATVTQQPGEAGLKRVEVAMPLSLALDQKNAKALCKPAEAQAKACPEGSIVGDATAVSSVLNRPLHGKVYFVEGTELTKSGVLKKTLPKLWVALRGEVALDVWADSTVKSKRLVSTFANVPDAPISSFELNIYGGKNGILGVTGQPGAHMCKQANVADAQFDGQNGKRFRSAATMSVPCRFGVVSKSIGASSVSVRATGLGTGRLTVSGSGVRTTRRSLREVQLATVRAPLSAAGLRAYRSGRSVRVKVSFKPTKGKTQTRTVVVKRATKKATARGGSTR